MELPEQDRQAFIDAARRRSQPQQGGAAFGVYPSSGKRPEKLNVSRDVNMPAQAARGWVAGTLGLPGDIESLGRMALNFSFGPGGVNVDETPVLPTSEFYQEYLPGGDERPAAKFASGLGALAGGAGSTKLAGAAVKGAKATGKALGPKAAEMAEGYLQKSGLAPTVVKPKGGNWLSGSVEGATKPLKTYQNPDQTVRFIETELQHVRRPEEKQQLERGLTRAQQESAINNWVDTKLNKYIRNEMATPEDPVRKLAERGVTHLPEGNLERANEWTPDTLGGRRKAAGFPEEGYATTPAGKGWEQLADEAIHNMPARERIKLRPAGYQDPDSWLDKVPPETMTYGVYRGIAEGDELGMQHLIDELRNATRADSDLPANLRWKPEDLKKVTMEQAVERVAKINEYRAAKKAEANEVLARNPATAPYKDYETVPGTQEPNSKGLAWKQIKMPEATLPEGYSARHLPEVDMWGIYDPQGGAAGMGATEREAMGLFRRDERKKSVEDALKYEGDVMGHCVGGYCDDVLTGESQIYSLRDKKGEPHVTIEVRPPKTYTEDDVIERFPGGVTDAMKQGDVGAKKYIAAKLAEMNDLNRPQEIIQIKGKGNAAPKEEYLPFVQDFVRSGNWSKVGDLKNTGLIKLGDQYLPKEEVGPLVERASRFIEETPALREHREAQRAYENYSGPVPSAEYTALQRAAGRQVHPTIPYTYRELRAILDDPDAFADRNTDALAPNLERIERLRQLVGEQGYAKGGLVEDTDAIAAKLTGMDKDKALTHALRMANAKQEAHMAAGGLAKLLKGAKKAEEATKAAKATEKAAEVAKPAIKGPQSEALETARKNAVKMLGLPENNTAMDRAKALGFDTDAYHGTNRNFPAFSNAMLGAKTGAKSAQKAHFSASSPHLASTYVSTEHVNPLPWKAGPPVYENLINNKQAWQEFNAAATDAEKWAVLERYGMNQGSGQVMPLMLRMENPRVRDYKGSQFRESTYNDELKAAKKGKKDSVVFKNTYDPGPHEGSNVMSDVYAVFDPSQIRSRFAAFDPARINENDLLGAADPALLAGTAVASGIGLGALGQMSKPKPEQEEKKKAAGGLAKRM